MTAFVQVIKVLITFFYFLKNILNLMPTPSNEVLTISPFAMIVLRASGKLNFIAISCPTNKR